MNTDTLLEEKLRACLHADRLPFHLDLMAARAALEIKLNASSSATAIKIRYFSPALKWVASAAAVLIAAFTAYNIAEVSFPKSNVVSTISLPDGSSIQIAPSTVGGFNRVSWLFSRAVYLDEGRAFFEVQKGKKFTVVSPQGSVAVLGTSFDITANASSYRVSCKTGKVAVTSADGLEKFTLTPGEYTALNGDDWILGAYTPDLADAWISGTYNFENTEVREVFQTLGSAFGYAVDMPNTLVKSPYTGSFATTQNLNDILRIVCKPSGLNYQIDEGRKTIMITNN